MTLLLELRCSIQPQLEGAGISGPIFVSIGDADKLNTFLDANEWMGRDRMFVEDYSFDAYRAAGFGRFDRVDRETVKNVKMTAPELGGFRGWMNYFSIVGKVPPVPKVCSYTRLYKRSIIFWGENKK